MSCDLFNTLIDSLFKNLPGKVRSERQNRLNKEKEHVFEFLVFWGGGRVIVLFQYVSFLRKNLRGKNSSDVDGRREVVKHPGVLRTF